jgi:hypothetical protein
MLFELQRNNPMVNLGKRNGEWCIGREVQDKMGHSHRSHSSCLLDLTHMGGVEEHRHHTLTLALKIANTT